MEKKEGIRSVNTSGMGWHQLNRNILVFSFFLLLSFIFWYLNSLGKELETTIRYPVAYKNIPQNKTQEEELPAKLRLTLKGYGYSILRLKISGNGSPVVIDFSETRYGRVRKGDQELGYLVTAKLMEDFNSQIKSDCRIISVRPDTLFFSLR